MPRKEQAMKSKRLFLTACLVAATTAAGWFLLIGSGFWEPVGVGRVKQIPAGHHEVAWISPATSTEAWERLVSAIVQMEKDWQESHGPSKLKVDLSNAFLSLSAGVPEIGLNFGDETQTLWIRWYKLSGENPSASWVKKLVERRRPPLAIIGGETSDRAHKLAKAIEECRGKWNGTDPLFLITTATAVSISPDDSDGFGRGPQQEWPKLIEVYAGRSFRFSFTNTRMVEALLDFVHQNPHVCNNTSSDPVQLAGMVGFGDPWACLGTMASMGQLQPWYLWGVTWWDDGYSRDMVSHFLTHFNDKVLKRKVGDVDPSSADQVNYSVGGYHQVNGPEAQAVGRLVAGAGGREKYHFLLALPTGSQRVRRFVANFYQQAPMEGRKFVVVSGDSMSFNTVFRDRQSAWNILDVQMPLIFFSHRLPTDTKAGFNWKASEKDPGAKTGTQDLLLDRDIVESLLLAAFDGSTLLRDSDAVMNRLRTTTWYRGRVHSSLESDRVPDGIPLFNEQGDRQPGTGEHIIWVQPLFEKEKTRILHRAHISIWGTNTKDIHRWRIRPTVSPPVTVSYNQQGPVVIHRNLENWILSSAAHLEFRFNPNEASEIVDHEGE